MVEILVEIFQRYSVYCVLSRSFLVFHVSVDIYMIYKYPIATFPCKILPLLSSFALDMLLCLLLFDM